MEPASSAPPAQCKELCCKRHSAAEELTREAKLSLLEQLGRELQGDAASGAGALLQRVLEVRAEEDAARRAAELVLPPEDDTCPLSFDPGQQLLPRTAAMYRAPCARLFLFLNALFFDHLGRFYCDGVLRVRETRLVLVRKAQPKRAPGDQRRAPLLFSPVLAPLQASKLEYMGSDWSNTLATYRLFGILAILLFVNASAWFITLITVFLDTAQGNPFNAVWAWQFTAMQDVARSVLEGVPTLLALALWAILAAVLAVLFFWLHVQAKQPQTRCLRGQVGLASVLPLTLTPRAPLCMVSYPWAEGHLDVARSLASCLPNCWIDVQMLVPGSDVPKITAGVSRWAFCLIICLSADYLQRNACVLEFVTAVLSRRWYQHTIAFLPEGTALSDRAVALVERLGVRVYKDPRALLRYMDSHIYACTTPDDAHRCTAWFGRVSAVRCDAPRGLRLPAPNIASTPVRLLQADRLLPPKHAICAGRHYLSADGATLGKYAAFSLEQLALAAALLFTAFSAGCMGGSYLQVARRTGEQLGLGTVLGLPAAALGIVLLLVGSTLPLRVDLGFANHHSPVLLPLNVAAFCNHLRDPSKSVYDKSVLGLGGFFGTVRGKIQKGMQTAGQTLARAGSHIASRLTPSSSASDGGGSWGGGGPVNEEAGKAGAPTASLLFSIAFLVPQGGGSELCDDSGAPLPRLSTAIGNMAAFLRLLGLDAGVLAMDNGQEEQLARATATLFVFVLPTLAAARAWQERWAHAAPPERSVLIVSEGVMRGAEYVRKFMLVLLGDSHGLSPMSSYAGEGLAVAVLDALGAKIGPAFLNRERESRRLGPQEREGRAASSSLRGGGAAAAGSSGGGGGSSGGGGGAGSSSSSGGGGGGGGGGVTVLNPLSAAQWAAERTGDAAAAP